jgi:hypothetical protein
MFIKIPPSTYEIIMKYGRYTLNTLISNLCYLGTSALNRSIMYIISYITCTMWWLDWPQQRTYLFKPEMHWKDHFTAQYDSLSLIKNPSVNLLIECDKIIWNTTNYYQITWVGGNCRNIKSDVLGLFKKLTTMVVLNGLCRRYLWTIWPYP